MVEFSLCSVSVLVDSISHPTPTISGLPLAAPNDSIYRVCLGRTNNFRSRVVRGAAEQLISDSLVLIGALSFRRSPFVSRFRINVGTGMKTLADGRYPQPLKSHNVGESK